MPERRQSAHVDADHKAARRDATAIQSREPAHVDADHKTATRDATVIQIVGAGPLPPPLSRQHDHRDDGLSSLRCVERVSGTEASICSRSGIPESNNNSNITCTCNISLKGGCESHNIFSDITGKYPNRNGRKNISMRCSGVPGNRFLEDSRLLSFGEQTGEYPSRDVRKDISTRCSGAPGNRFVGDDRLCNFRSDDGRNTKAAGSIFSGTRR